MNWFEPLNYTDSNHVEASETKLQFYAGWFANPIYINGKYPNIMRQKVKCLHILLCQVNLHLHSFNFDCRLMVKVLRKVMRSLDCRSLQKKKAWKYKAHQISTVSTFTRPTLHIQNL